MGFFGTLENEAGLVARYSKRIRNWASKPSRRILIISVLSVTLASANYWYLSHMVSVSKEESARRLKDLTDSQYVNQHLLVIEYIDACMVTSQGNQPLHSWYCDKAASLFKDLTDKWPKDHVKELLERRAYIAMKIDVSHHMRSIEATNRFNSQTPEPELLLQLFQNGYLYGLIVLLATLLVLGVFFYLYAFHNRRIVNPSTE